MGHFRSGTFWASAIFGWFVTMIVLAVMLSISGSEQMTTAEGIVANVALQLLSVVAGYVYGRRQFELRQPKHVGFPVITKDSGDSAAELPPHCNGPAGRNGPCDSWTARCPAGR